MSSGIKICILVWFQCICFGGQAVLAQIVTNLTQYTTEDGLSDNRVMDIIKDREGFMWFGSWAGITRFDGHNFLTFKSYPGDRSSLKSNRIDEIVEDFGGRHLWIRAYDKQVYRFDKQTQQYASLEELLNDKLVASLSFSKILAVRENVVWLKTEEKGVILINNSAAAKPVFSVFSKEQEIPFKIPANKIRFFLVDNFKNAWLGTPAGLAVLKRQSNGSYQVKTVDRLRGQVITSAANAKNLVWLATDDGSVLSVDSNLKQQAQYKVSSTSLNHILVSKKSDKLYCTTPAGGLIAINKSGQQEQLISSAKRAAALIYMFEDRSGVLWIESENAGIVRYDPGSGKVSRLFPPKDYHFTPQSRSLMIFEDKNSRVWARLDGQVSYYDVTKDQMVLLDLQLDRYKNSLSGEISRIFYDPDGVLWVGTGYDGVTKLVFQEHDFSKYIPVPGSKVSLENQVRGILTDRKNRLWFGTKAGELFVFQNERRIHNVLESKPRNPAGIYSILQDNSGKVWLGTKGNGLIKAVPVDTKETKYAVTEYAADRKAPGDISSNSIYCLLQDKKGRLWAGAYDEGLILIEEKEGKTSFKTVINCFRNYPEGGFRRIRHLAEDIKGRIWIGTTNGLLVFDPNSGRPENYVFRQYKKEPGNIRSLGGNDIQFIFQDSRKQMWVLTTTGGLNLAQGSDPLKTLSFINYSTRNGLPGDFLLSCTEDDRGNLWIASQNALSKFSLDKRKFQNFGRSDGLQGMKFSEAACTKMAGGVIIFGTASGYISFDPKRIRTQKISSPMAFTNLQINSEDIVPGDSSILQVSINNTEKITLDYDQDVISIDFAVLDFHSVDKQNYAYRLLGFDNVWRTTEGQRRATYNKLPPGNYVFEVKSLNEELYEQIPSRSLHITVLPPPWRTWWAYTIYFVLACIAFWVIRRVAITMLRLRQGMAVERKLADLKLGFFTQISHELRTPLTLIINPSEEILEKESLSDKGKEYMTVVVKNARRMLRLVNQVLDLRKVQSGKATLNLSEVELRSFIGEMPAYFRETISHRNLRVEIDARDEIWAWIDAEKLEIVLYNLLANAIKFSPDNSRIRIGISQDESLQSLKIEVADEGSGVQEDELEDIFKLYYEGKTGSAKQVKGTGIGLALSKELVELHGGKIYAGHNFPSGLKVVIELLPGKDHFQAESRDTGDFKPDRNLQEYSVSEIRESGEEPQFFKAGELPLLLIVEDNDDLRRFLATKFAGRYQVEAAANGLEGYQKAKELLPDLVLSDVMMPEMDGIEMLDRLKNDPLPSHLPVVLLTARYSVESQIQALKYGADYYITKPFSMELLQLAVNNIIGKRREIFRALQDEEAEGQDIEESQDQSQDESQTSQTSQTRDIVITDYDRKFLEKILQIVEGRLDDAQFNIENVAQSMDMSRSAFYRKFKSLTNLSPVEFVRDTRLKKAKALLDAGESNISVAAYSVGFSNPKYFSSCFKAHYGQSPSDYVKSMKRPGRTGSDSIIKKEDIQR